MVNIGNINIDKSHIVIADHADNTEKGQNYAKGNQRVNLSSMKLENTKKIKIFIVHGRDNFNMREVIARFLEQNWFETIILDQKPDEGLAIIEKFEKYASDVMYAVVLLTPDDLGGLAPLNPLSLSPRARQNVIFEMGYFYGKLGRDKVCILHQEIEVPSDLKGVLYIHMDKMGAWKHRMIEEIKAKINPEYD